MKEHAAAARTVAIRTDVHEHSAALLQVCRVGPVEILLGGLGVIPVGVRVRGPTHDGDKDLETPDGGVGI